MQHLIVKIFKLSTPGKLLKYFLPLLLHTTVEKNNYIGILCFSTTLILANKLMAQWNYDKAGRRYFEGSLKFQATLTSVLDMLTNRISLMAQEDIYGANVSQMWGIVLLVFVMFLSPILIILAKNAISSIQLFASMTKIIELYRTDNINYNLIFFFSKR